MASLPIGSNKLLEIRTSDVTIVIKSKKQQTVKSEDSDKRSSSLVVKGYDLERILVLNQEYGKPSGNGITKGYEMYSLDVYPMFFEQTDYELLISSNIGKAVGFWNEYYLLREKVSPVIDGNDTLISGIINFGNSCGYSDFEIYSDGKKVLTLRLEVYPTKISYREDYQRMVADVSEMVYGAAIDFMQKTYQEFSIGNTQNSVPAIFFQIMSAVFEKYIRAAKHIISKPHHKLITEHVVVPEHKAKRIDRKSERWLMNHPSHAQINGGDLEVSKILSVKKQITYDTTENRFVKFILQGTIRKLEDFIKRYDESKNYYDSHVEESVIESANYMIRQIRSLLNTSFLREVSDYQAMQSMSLVFGMAPGYRELYKYYLMLQRGLSVNGDFFRISVKNTAKLYEYWCFIKLFSLLKKEYKLVSPDIIKVDNTGVTVTLVQGTKSEVLFLNPRTGEQITLIYNPGETKTQTVNQKPDNVLELEKKGSKVSYKYVFDAKYRIEQNPDNNYYPDKNPGPKVDDINTMHRYRDSIVYENKESRFMFEKTMFGAYILFPYDNEELYKEHKFYKSIDSVNIGGLPFLPGATTLVQKLLDELIADSKESAFERATLPRGIEEKLSVVDWSKKDVLIGIVRSLDQYDTCFDENVYYIPAKRVASSRLPIHYVALYKTKEDFGKEAGIEYYGEVLRTELVERDDISDTAFIADNKDQVFYKFYVREWLELPNVIKPREKGFSVEFTNLFLLEHGESLPELLFENEEQYRFYSELKRNVSASIVNDNNNCIGFEYGNVIYSFAQGMIYTLRDGKNYGIIDISDFAKKPGEVFRRLISYSNQD